MSRSFPARIVGPATAPDEAAHNDNLVSIVTPAWRAARVVGDTIESVLSQTYTNWEMLVVDDCSADDTAAVIEGYAASDPRVRLLRNASNSGPAIARNTALAVANGRWIAFLDSDDVWLPTKLERTLAHARSHDAAITFTGFRRMNSNGSKVGRYIGVPSTVSYTGLLGNTVIATSTAMVDRKLAGDFRMKSVFYDDLSCWLDILRPGRLAHGLDEDLVRYRVMSASVSRNKLRSAREVWRTFRNIEGMSSATALFHFSRYALNGVMKYRSF